MGRVYQVGNEYFVEFMARGLVYQQKAGEDWVKAKELLDSIEAKIACGEALSLVQDVKWSAFFDDYIRLIRLSYYPKTVSRFETTIAHFSEFLKSHRSDVLLLSEITPRIIEEYKAFGIQELLSFAKELNPKIVNLTLLLLREIFEQGVKTGLINDNPTLHVRLLEVKPSNGLCFFSDEQLGKLANAVKKQYQDAFVLMRNTGLRYHELMDLSWKNVDFNRQIIFVRLREVPLRPEARDILLRRFDRVIDYKARVFIDTLDLHDVLNNACAEIGIHGIFSLSCFRHAFAIDLLRRNFSLPVIGRLLGVSDVAKLMIYASYIPLIRPEIEE